MHILNLRFEMKQVHEKVGNKRFHVVMDVVMFFLSAE